jgi:hypothetical protein
MKMTLLLLLTVISVGCGYSKSTMPQQPGTMPAIAQLSPNSVIAGSSSFAFEVDGTNFGSAAVINFNGPQTTTRVSATKLTTTIPASAIMNAGTVLVTVTNPGTPGGIYGGGTAAATSTPMNFTIN